MEQTKSQAIYDLLTDLAGIDTYDTNLRDSQEAHRFVELFVQRECRSPTAPAVVAPVAMTEQVAQPLYDLAWKHGARQHVSFAGDELESLSFTPGEFEAFCTELSPAASAEGVTDVQKALIGDIEFIVDEWRENGCGNADGALSRIASAIDDATLSDMKARNAPTQEASPDGWQLVPKEPTAAMLMAGYRPDLKSAERAEMYRAMLTAAPAASLREQEDDSTRLEWLMWVISGKEFRRVGVNYGASPNRAAIDEAMKQDPLPDAQRLGREKGGEK